MTELGIYFFAYFSYYFGDIRVILEMGFLTLARAGKLRMAYLYLNFFYISYKKYLDLIDIIFKPFDMGFILLQPLD